jgi:hypothetical protein
MTYGIPVQRRNDPLVRSAESVFAALGGAAAPGKYFVNIMPQLKYVPEWMPGAGFKRYAKEVRRCAVRLMNEPFQVSRKESVRPGCVLLVDVIVSSSSSIFLRRMELPQYPSFQRLWNSIAGNQIMNFMPIRSSRLRFRCSEVSCLESTFFTQPLIITSAFSETTVASAVTFILAMLIHPGIQEKAQREVDSVVGYDRLPEFSDIPNLPYMSAIVKEVLRFVESYTRPLHKSRKSVCLTPRQMESPAAFRTAPFD